MDWIGIFAVAPVDDYDAAVDWYTRFFGGAPDDKPMPGLAQWHNGAAGYQVWRDPERAGSGAATLVVADIDRWRARLAAAEIEVGPTTLGDVSRIAQVEDPAGNTLTLAEPPPLPPPDVA